VTEGYGVALFGAALVVAVVTEMLRRRRIRGRFAIVWIGVAGVTAVLALAPDLLGLAARLTGVLVPLNLLFFIGFLGSLLIQLQLTVASGRAESELRSLAEEVAILRAELGARKPQGPQHPRAATEDPVLEDATPQNGAE
jgi:hypothetical protein